MNTFVRWLATSLMVVSVGLHVPVLQTTAWFGMLVGYSVKNQSLAQGFSDTFDGEHPCPLCHAVKSMNDNDSSRGLEETPLFAKFKVEFCHPTVATLILPKPMGDAVEITEGNFGTARSQAPPLPPPKPLA